MGASGWIGVDEVGRGAWAGPVVVGAAWGPPEAAWGVLARGPSVADSKALTPRARARALTALEASGIVTRVGLASAREVDAIGLKAALGVAAELALEDAPRWRVHLDGRTSYLGRLAPMCIVGGDRSDPLIAAASIAAKLARDAMMVALDEELPWWSFGVHKGYGTRRHREALAAYGVSTEHRRSVRPVAAAARGGLSMCDPESQVE